MTIPPLQTFFEIAVWHVAAVVTCAPCKMNASSRSNANSSGGAIGHRSRGVLWNVFFSNETCSATCRKSGFVAREGIKKSYVKCAFYYYLGHAKALPCAVLFQCIKVVKSRIV